MKLCVSISAPSRQGALREMEEAAVAAEMLELRMDAIGDVPLAALLEEARSLTPAPAVIVTNRRREEGGMRRPAAGERPEEAERRRVDLLIEAVKRGAEYVDIELSTEAGLRESLRAEIARSGFRTALIVSHHDFRRTPSLLRLKGIYNDCAGAGATIVKVVTTAVRPGDNLRILELVVHARRECQPIVAFCMGGAGRISRLTAPLLGAEFGFACLREGEGSAPGQLTVQDMRQVLKILDCGKGEKE